MLKVFLLFFYVTDMNQLRLDSLFLHTNLHFGPNILLLALLQHPLSLHGGVRKLLLSSLIMLILI